LVCGAIDQFFPRAIEIAENGYNAQETAVTGMTDYTLYWGEIHNHNELGYAQGSLERSYDIARSHLDFYSFTPHGLHADGGMPDGFPIVNAHWDKIRQAAIDHDDPGTFTCFLGYEWHSQRWGHLHVVSAEDAESMYCATSYEGLQDHFRGRPTILVPHHIGYHQGVDWELFDEDVSPVVEIFSEHGCSERDTGPFPMLGHSGGPGAAQFTAQHALASGAKFGFTAGTDNHDGHPGGYGLGLTGVWAQQNTRQGIMEGLRSRRTIAVTGDRIGVTFNVGEAPMGSAVQECGATELSYTVQGWDFIKQVELLRDNVPVQMQTPDYITAERSGEQLYRLRLEWGWGPMKGYQVYDWQGRLQIEDGRLQQVVPCFTSDPFDEQRRKRVQTEDASGCTWESHTSRGGIFTSRNGATAPSANDALCVEVNGSEKTRLTIAFDCTTHKSLLATGPDLMISPHLGHVERTFSIAQLLEGRQGFKVEGMPTWVLAHRAVPPHRYTMTGGYHHPAGEAACYYLRVTQENGQMAWASPLWLGE